MKTNDIIREAMKSPTMTGQKLAAKLTLHAEELESELAEARRSRAEVVEKYQASVKEMHEVGQQRDRLAEALQNLCDRFLGKESSKDITAQLVEAGKALAAVNQPSRAEFSKISDTLAESIQSAMGGNPEVL